MKLLKNKFDIELNLFEHFQYYVYIKEKLIKKNYNLNEEKWAKDSFLVTKNKSIHLDFKSFVNKLLSTNIKNKQSNNHFFLRTLLAEKNEKYIRISYSNLYKKLDNLSLENIKIGDKNIGAKNIYSNKILTNETENILKVNFLETNYREFIRKQDKERLNPKIILDTHENELYLDITSQTNFVKHIQDYISLQVVRNESLFLNLIDLFKPHTEIENFNLFDYLFFKYIYNYSVKEHFKNMQKKLINFNYVRIQNFLLPDFSPLNFCMNEFNTIRLLTFEPLPEYRKFFKEDDLNEIENIFISVARSNSFLFLSKKQISDSLLKKITNFLIEIWDHTCLATTLRTFLVPKESPLLNINFFKNQLNKEDYDRTITLESLFEKSEIFEEKIELLLPKI